MEIKDEPKYKDEKWLREQYVTKKQTGPEIANICGVHCDTIYSWLKKLNIESRGTPNGKVEKKCEQCGTKYRIRPSHASGSRFCSRECSAKWKSEKIKGKNHPNWEGGRITKECDYCGEKFKTYKYKKQKFCSQKCHYKWKGENWEPNNKSIIIHVCQRCGKRFVTTLKGKKNKFCSARCQNKWHSKHFSGKKHPLWSGGKLEMTCHYCGKKIEVWPYQKGKRTFCSSECQNDWQSEFRNGKNHPNWKGGYNEYVKKLTNNSGNWIKNRKLTLERDHHTCQVCGAEENGRKHDVHHIKPVRKGGSNFVGNLITLCRSCHIRVENE